MYQALYRQYRPKTFDDVLGQEHITVTLKNQIKNNNVSHAYLFSGTKGTGKTSTAKIFSRAVNCLNNEDGNPCNECEICKGILNESIIDVVEMDAASNRKIEDIRDLKDKVIYPPSRARYKIYIIDEVHMLTNEAFNALLKTLEEPPKHLIFILATTEMERLPQTILSRCQRFEFKRITVDNIILNMKAILEDKDVVVEDRALSLIARNSEGAMRDALSLLDQCIAYSDRVDYEDALEILGIANTDLLFQLVDYIYNKDVENILMQIDEIIQEGKDMNQFIKDLILHFRNLLIVKSSDASLDILNMDEELYKQYREQGEKFSLDFILKALDTLAESEDQAKWSSQPRVILEMSLIKLVKLKDDYNLMERISRLESALKTGKIEIQPDREDSPRERLEPSYSKETPSREVVDNKEEVKDGAVMSDRDLSLDDAQKHWPAILNEIKKQSVKLYAFLIEADLYSYEEDTISLVYPSSHNFHMEAISMAENKDELEKIVSKYLNKDISFDFYMENQIEDIDKNKKKDLKEDLVDFFGPDKVEIQ